MVRASDIARPLACDLLRDGVLDMQDAIKKSREPHEVLNEIGGDGGPDAD